MTTPTPPMSITIGGQLVSLALPVVDTSTPTSTEAFFNKILKEYTDENIQLESEDGKQKRERVIN